MIAGGNPGAQCVRRSDAVFSASRRDVVLAASESHPPVMNSEFQQLCEISCVRGTGSKAVFPTEMQNDAERGLA